MNTQVLEHIGGIAILKNGNSYLIRFTHQKKIYQLGRGKISPENLKATRAIASQINSDILFNKFTGLDKYRKPEIKRDTKTFKELWLDFVVYQSKFIKASTFRAYKDIER
ncbi:MAG: hypothetical protein VKL41_21540, partial [Snowella sp.]|nr:hypothetical protein [Snowella sp.]